LGVEPLDDFIKDISDFIHYILTKDPRISGGKVEVEAKIGVLRDKTSGQRLQLPVMVETSNVSFSLFSA
jgi:polynucleotide 5'-triphosphatase